MDNLELYNRLYNKMVDIENLLILKDVIDGYLVVHST